MSCPVVLTVAGSDSGGGAGIQADIRTISRLGAFATTAITAVTAQNPDGVRDVRVLDGPFVSAQIGAVRDAFEISASKTGMLATAEIIAAVAEAAEAGVLGPLVVDPVMIATSGARLLAEDAVQGYVDRLCPCAAVVTPNLDEAAALLGRAITRGGLEKAATELEKQLRAPILLKGGHLNGDPVDVLSIEGRITRFTHQRIDGVLTHGTGCTLSAALATQLARGRTLIEASAAAIAFVAKALETPSHPRGGSPHLGIS
jgi:hydroxymethylpyrimidine/phosphomethylpyrimidine kinase